MKGVQCYELFGGIALKNHAFSLLMSERRSTTRKSHYLYQGSSSVLINRHLRRISTFQSNADKFSENMKSFLAFPMLCSNKYT